MYLVVFEATVGPLKGELSWQPFASKEFFDRWYDKPIKESYKVVAEGIPRLRVIELLARAEVTVD